MIQLLFLLLALLGQGTAPKTASIQPLEKSAYFAFVDRDYIFTLEVEKPGVPIFNFVSMTDQENAIPAKNIQLSLENHKVPVKFFTIDTGDRDPMAVSSMTIHRRSSFGFKLNGDFDNAKELYGAAVRVGNENFTLVPLTSFDFEALAAKVNHINLGSPDFSDDWRVLKLESMGTRSRARK
jgi:hypothetical protein